MSHLINAAAVRRLALDVANERREQIFASLGIKEKMKPWNSVGAAFLQEIEADVRRATEKRAAEHWQKGRTLQ